MPNTPIRRVRQVWTGVAGSPWYLNGFFSGDTGSTQQCIDAWSTFCVAATAGPTAGIPAGATAVTQGDVRVINPIDGQAIGTEQGISRTVTGTGTGPFLPPANQALVRWHTGNFEAGREVRGRTNLPAQIEANSTTTGQLESAAITAFETRAAALIADAATVFIVWSKKNGVWWAVSSASCWPQFSVLRSRRD